MALPRSQPTSGRVLRWAFSACRSLLTRGLGPKSYVDFRVSPVLACGRLGTLPIDVRPLKRLPFSLLEITVAFCGDVMNLFMASHKQAHGNVGGFAL